jgi:ligand-binding sensor domain-containing protein
VFDRAKSVLYAGTRSGVFQTSNGGGTWTSVGSGLINPSVNALVLGPAEALYAATDGAGVFRLDSPSPDRQLVDGSPERPPTRTVGPRF